MESKALQVLTLKMGVQQMKNKITITISIRMTSFLAIRLAEEVLLLGRSTFWLLLQELLDES